MVRSRRTRVANSAGVWILAGLVFPGFCSAEAPSVQTLVETINGVGKEGAGHPEAMVAWKALNAADIQDVPQILAGISADNPLATNWIRAAVESVVQRGLQTGQSLPQEALKQVLDNTALAPRGRRLAFELLRDAEPESSEVLIAGRLNDPSLEIRRDAVALVVVQAEQCLQADNKLQAIDHLKTAFSAARDRDQVAAIAERLQQLNQPVDLPAHFGFLARWKLIAPFDNTAGVGFDQAYEPERELRLDATYQGKSGPVSWMDHTTDDPYGQVDLNQAVGKLKGAVAYACYVFETSEARNVELRFGCINANKLWLNGQLLTANEVYHSGSYMDQYVGRGRLEAGENVILLKVAQNEQTEAWAQRWQFQLRVCDDLGTAVLPTN